jgi:hypothetical protein
MQAILLTIWYLSDRTVLDGVSLGENIDIWSLEELKQQVSRFKELASKKFEVVEEEHQHEKEDTGHSLQNLTQTLFQREGKLKPVTY